jgi:hypothetical protein
MGFGLGNGKKREKGPVLEVFGDFGNVGCFGFVVCFNM